MSEVPVKCSHGENIKTRSCFYYPFPMELSRETDALRPKRGGKGRLTRKGEGRTETSGGGTAYFKASKNGGADFEEHSGPVPGAGSERSATPCPNTDDTRPSHENDIRPPN